MKIALVNNQYQLGGAETVVGQLRRGIVAAGHEITLHVAHGRDYPTGVWPLYPPLLSRLHHSRFHGLVEKFAPRFLWTDAAFRRLAESDADLIHLHNFHGDYAGIESLAHVVSRKKLVWTFHALWGVTGGCDHPRDCRRYLEHCGQCPQVGRWPVGPVDRTVEQLAEKMERIAGKHIHIVAPSRWLGEIVRGSRVGGRWNVHEIVNGVDPARFAPRPRTAPDDIRILIVNRNFADEQKGFAMAQRALELIEMPRITVILAGQNSDWAASRIPSRFKVQVAGFVQDSAKLAELYARADIFLFASPAENFPCVILEAMASGCCVVATPSGGVVEQIEDGHSGLLAGAVNGESLGTALQSALGDAELRNRLGRAARERVIAHFTEERMIDAHLKLYRTVIDEN